MQTKSGMNVFSNPICALPHSNAAFSCKKTSQIERDCHNHVEY